MCNGIRELGVDTILLLPATAPGLATWPVYNPITPTTLKYNSPSPNLAVGAREVGQHGRALTWDIRALAGFPSRCSVPDAGDTHHMRKGEAVRRLDMVSESN